MTYVMLAVTFAVLCMLCAFVGFLSGYMLGKFKAARLTYAVQSELDEKTVAELQKRQREYENFMNYDGSRQ